MSARLLRACAGWCGSDATAASAKRNSAPTIVQAPRFGLLTSPCRRARSFRPQPGRVGLGASVVSARQPTLTCNACTRASVCAGIPNAAAASAHRGRTLQQLGAVRGAASAGLNPGGDAALKAVALVAHGTGGPEFKARGPAAQGLSATSRGRVFMFAVAPERRADRAQSFGSDAGRARVGENVGQGCDSV
jgi:hypothetical protein